ncbi:hypothetical protein SUGI_0185050 [Cryptomeria japonica]|uniref:cyclin-D3-1 isoform X2 n=1 Tax=Cryptomeria japonica TaxID=3369 RepID=UPI002408A945|nr:cyclin-D3-1 isoform X2 [Cryptomeria japonica]GLJ12130.1 hypothetical protein SUGI_0185050 [Cryptomeria japonica]
MAPSFDCVSNLLCAEDASLVAWDDEEVENNGVDDNGVNRSAHPGFGHHEPVASLPVFPLEDDESVSLLVEKEGDHMPQEGYLNSYRIRTLDLSIRQDAMGWILKVHAYYSFGPLTAYLAINYLDRFLSRYQLPQGKVWMLQLLSVACLSLAAKMEETDVPLLIDLQIGDVKFVFEARTIQRMEGLVLTTLDWRLRSVTPFSFLDYFLHKATGDISPPRALIARSIDFILGTSKVIEFLEHRPSAIAASAVMCAAEEVMPSVAVDFKRALSCCEILDNERIYSCYGVMQEQLDERAKVQMSKKQVYGSISFSIPRSPVGVLDAACLSCNSETTMASALSVSPPAMIGAKRRRLNVFCNAG